MRVVLIVALAGALWASPAAALAGDAANDGDSDGRTLIYGLTPTQLAIAAAVGVAAGTAGALVSTNVIAGASLGFGTLAAIYVAHLAAEAAVVGGVYYWWPWQAKPEDSASRTMVIRGVDARAGVIPSLQLSR